MADLVNLNVPLDVDKVEDIESSPFDLEDKLEVDTPLEVGKVYEVLEDIKKEDEDNIGLVISKGSYVKVYKVKGNTFRIIFEDVNRHNQVVKVIAMDVEGNLNRFKEVGECEVYGLKREVIDSSDVEDNDEISEI